MKWVYQSRDYRRVLITMQESGQLPDEIRDEFPFIYPFLVETDLEGEYPKQDIWQEIKNSKRYAWALVYDIDFLKDIKAQIKEKELSNDEPSWALNVFRVYNAYQLLNKLKAVITDTDVAIEFAYSKTNFHILILLEEPIPYVPETIEIFKQEYLHFQQIIQKALPYYYELDPYNDAKFTYHTWIEFPDNPEIFLSYKEDLTYIYSTYLTMPDNNEHKDPYKLQKILPEMVETFQKGDHEGVSLIGGRHNSFVFLLAGELALSGFSLAEALSIYEKYFQPLDNPKDVYNRKQVIKATYERKERGEPILAWRHFRREWRLTRPYKIWKAPENEEFRRRGVKSFVYPTPEGMMEYRYIDKEKKKKKRALNFPYLVFFNELRDGDITFTVQNEKESYVITIANPNSPDRVKDFLNDPQLAKFSARELRTLLYIVKNYVEWRHWWNENEGIPVMTTDNLRNSTVKRTGWNVVKALWSHNKLYRVSIALALARYQNDIPNPILRISGRSGVGKSRTLSFLANAFDTPFSNAIATFNAIETQLTNANRKPVIYDELGTAGLESSIVNNLIHTVHFGKGKSRRGSSSKDGNTYQKPIKATLFLAGEFDIDIHHYASKGTAGALRKSFIFKVKEQLVFPEMPAYGSGWATLLKPIPPVSTQPQTHQGYAFTIYPYFAGIYEFFNRLFNTNFNPQEEFSYISDHLLNFVRYSTYAKLKQWILKEYHKERGSLLKRDGQNYYILPETIPLIAQDLGGEDVEMLREILRENFERGTYLNHFGERVKGYIVNKVIYEERAVDEMANGGDDDTDIEF